MSNIRIKRGDILVDIKDDQIISRDDVRKRIWITFDKDTKVYVKTELIDGDVGYNNFSRCLIEAEYIASRILKAMNVPVHEVELVKLTYEDGVERLACMCYDITNDTDYIIESLVDILCYVKEIGNSVPTFKLIEAIVRKIEKLDIEEYLNFIYKMFVADMLIGNYDRSFGNIAMLKNEKHTTICPLYDNTATMGVSRSNENLSDAEIYEQIRNTNSAMYYDNKQSINYISFFKNIEYLDDIDTERMYGAIKEIYQSVDISKIEKIILNASFIDENRKKYYSNYFRVGYEQVLIPTLERLNKRETN